MKPRKNNGAPLLSTHMPCQENLATETVLLWTIEDLRRWGSLHSACFTSCPSIGTKWRWKTLWRVFQRWPTLLHLQFTQPPPTSTNSARTTVTKSLNPVNFYPPYTLCSVFDQFTIPSLKYPPFLASRISILLVSLAQMPPPQRSLLWLPYLKWLLGTPWWSRVQSELSLPRAQVQSLGGELRPCKSCNTA